MECKKATCEDITIKNSKIHEGSIELKSSDGSVSFSVTDTSNDRLNSELSATVLSFNSNITRNAAMMGVYNNTGYGFISVEGDIDCYVLHQTSLAEKKKNIEKFTNALEIVKNTDIYSYNFKHEDDDSKKHIGPVIGVGYNIANEIVSEDGKSTEPYSMVSTLWRAVQLQQELIEYLFSKIEGGK